MNKFEQVSNDDHQMTSKCGNYVQRAGLGIPGRLRCLGIPSMVMGILGVILEVVIPGPIFVGWGGGGGAGVHHIM